MRVGNSLYIQTELLEVGIEGREHLDGRRERAACREVKHVGAVEDLLFRKIDHQVVAGMRIGHTINFDTTITALYDVPVIDQLEFRLADFQCRHVGGIQFAILDDSRDVVFVATGRDEGGSLRQRER